ncbi:HTH_Tnp_Tc3_2 domain-containing protein [Trichonephila clavipes]|nr:HTH_Tnp_Tc3_2 domain-containing protein [Trichonephila clavipes]
MAVTDHSVTSRTVAQHIWAATHHSVSARTIRGRLQQSGLSVRRPLLGLPLTQNQRHLHRHWCNERRIMQCRYFKQPALHFRGVGVSCPPLPSGPQPYLIRIMCVHTWHALSNCSLSITRLNFLTGWLALQILADRKHVVVGCSTIDPDYTPSCPPDQLWQRVEAAWSAVPHEHIQSLFESMPTEACGSGDLQK